MPEFLVIAVAYLLGSVPFAFLLSRRRGIDLRRAGSGNIGASNVLRTSGARAAAVAVCLDAAKGAAAVMVANRFEAGTAVAAAAGVAAVLGHVFPVWLRFHGGKGVATSAGVFGVLAPAAVVVAVVVFGTVVWRTRYVSVGSIAGSAALVFGVIITGAPEGVLVAAAVLAVVIFLRHRGNLSRLRSGTERRLGQRHMVELIR